ncbi:MAG: hypothetical protein Q9202_006948 [Teloschistes flavicans]
MTTKLNEYKMTYQQELASWLSPSPIATAPSPSIGSTAPSTPKLPFPNSNDRPVLVTFLRHCGCPFAEKTFLRLRATADAHQNITFIAVSHSDQSSTDTWLEAVGGPGKVEVIINPDREIYAAWGLGISSFWHALNPGNLRSAYKLWKEEGIWNRPTESGSRWQTAGSFGVDAQGIVRWGQTAPGADWVPDFEDAVKVLEDKRHLG